MEKRIEDIIKNNRPDIEDLDNALFVEEGLFDSFDIVTLVPQLEKTFSVSIDGADITPENFNSVKSIVELLKKNGAK